MKDYKINILEFHTTDKGESVFVYEADGIKYHQRGYYPILYAKKIDFYDVDVIEMYFESVPLEHNKPRVIL